MAESPGSMGQLDSLMDGVGCPFGAINFDKYPAQVYFKDLSGEYVYINMAIEKDYQSSAEQFLGLTIEDTPFQLFMSAYSYSDQCASKSGFFECIEPMLIKGNIVPAQSKKILLQDNEKKPLGVLAFLEELHGCTWPTINQGRAIEISINEFVSHTYFHGMSLRETEVLYLMLRGLSGSKIASELGLSTRTVETYIENMKNKLSIDSKAELIQKAFDMGFVFFTPERFAKK